MSIKEMTLSTTMLLHIFLISGDLGAAEFSQVRPTSDEFMELPQTNWLKNGGDFYNRNYSQLDQINTSNVGEMIPLWRSHLAGSGVEARFSGEAQPIVQDGTMYIITGADDVFALSVETGEILWRNFANLSNEISTVCCGGRVGVLRSGKIKCLLDSLMVF